MRNNESIVDIPFPYSGRALVRTSFQRLFFKVLHVQIGNDSGDRAAHGRSFLLFVILSVVHEVRGFQDEFQEFGDLPGGQAGAGREPDISLHALKGDTASGFNRNVSKQ